jgi:hypothetical protein
MKRKGIKGALRKGAKLLSKKGRPKSTQINTEMDNFKNNEQ